MKILVFISYGIILISFFLCLSIGKLPVVPVVALAVLYIWDKVIKE